MNKRLGSNETMLLSWVQMRGKNRLETGEAQKSLGITPIQEAKILSRLSRSGWITRLTTSVYLVPPKLPPGGKWSPPEALVLKELMATYGAQYQLTGAKVFNRYRLTNQVPQETSLYNDKISGRRTIGGLSYQFIKVPEQRLGGVEKADNTSLRYPTLGRALMDAIYDWSRFNTLPQAYRWIREKRKDRVVMKDLVRSALRYGNVATRRRLGYWLETLKVEPALVRSLLKSVSETSSVIPFVPGRPTRGTVNRKWGVVINAEI